MPTEDYAVRTGYYTRFARNDDYSFISERVNVHVGQKVRIVPMLNGVHLSMYGAFAFVTDLAFGYGGEILYLIVCIMSGEHNGKRVAVSPSEIEVW